MKFIFGEIFTHINNQTTTTLATCWRVERLDGEMFCFTDHDEDIVFRGLTYRAQTGFMRSAITNSATMQVDDMEVEGFLDDASITEQELRAGKFDYAEVFIFLLNYENTVNVDMNDLPLRYGRFGEVQITSSGKFVIELRGLIQQLQQTAGQVYTPECRVDLFSRQCGVKGAASPRKSGGTYEVGDRYISAGELTKTYLLPIPNPDFTIGEYSTSPGWLIDGGVVTQSPLNESLNALKTTAWVASANTSVAVQDALAGIPLNTERPVTFVVNWLSNSSFQRMRLTLEFLDSEGQRLSFASTPYQSFQTSGSSTETRTLEAFAPVGTVSIQAAMQFNELNTPTINNQTFSGSSRSFVTRAQLLIPFDETSTAQAIENDQFQGAQLVSGSAAGWRGVNTNATPPVVTSSQGMLGPDGMRFVMCGFMNSFNGGGVIWRTDELGLTTGPVTAEDIDTGNFYLDLEWLQANSDTPGTVGLTAQFIRPSMSEVLPDPIFTATIPTREWQRRERRLPVPVGARSVRLRIHFSHTNINVSAFNRVGVTRIRATLKPDERAANVLDYGGVEYEVTQAGVLSLAALTDPPRTVGTTFQDGTATVQVVEPQWAFIAPIGNVLSRGRFTLPSLNKPTNWFQWGLLEFLTGPAKGYTMECIGWNADTKVCDLVLPVPFRPEPGDLVRIQTGCDKKIGTCAAKFSNAINFRGEPYLPGTDTYFRVGSPGTRGR